MSEIGEKSISTVLMVLPEPHSGTLVGAPIGFVFEWP